MKKKLLGAASFFLFNCIFCFNVFAANTLTLYDDFNDNSIDSTKWLVEPSESAGALNENNSAFNINRGFYQGQGVQAYLLGPDQSFDALEAKIKLSSETEPGGSFGIIAFLWNDGLFDYSGAILFSRLYKDDPLVIRGSISKGLDRNNSFTVYYKSLIENASYDTWYRVRIERDGANINFYVKEGIEEIGSNDLKDTYAIQSAIKPPTSNFLFLRAGNLSIFEATAVAGSADDIFVGSARPTYTISGKIEGALCDNATMALYESSSPFQTIKVNADGTYAFRLLSDQKTYSVGSASLCCPLDPDKKTVTMQGADQKDMNFTVKADNASAEIVYAITGARLIDGNGSEPVDDALIIIKGNTIQSVSRSGEAEIPAGAQVIDATGKTIIPGLHDMHVHIVVESNPYFGSYYMPQEPVGGEFQKRLYAFLFCGVTSVFDVGSFTSENLIFSLRKQEQEHCLLAPRIFSVGAGITYPHGYGFFPATRVASNPQEAVQVIDDLVKKKPDMVKILYENKLYGQKFPTFDTATLKALIDESRKQGFKTTVHVSNPGLAKKLAPLQPDAFAHFPTHANRKAEHLMIQNHISCTPTLMVFTSLGRFFSNPALIEEDIIKACVDPRLLSAYKEPALLEAVRRHQLGGYTGYFKYIFRSLKRVFAAGGKIIMGSDPGGGAVVFHGPSAHEEIGMYVKAGLTPLQVITTATRNGAEYVGKLDRQGTIEEGKLADLVILKADPSDNISNTKKIALVMKDGKIMDRGMLSRDITGRLSEEARYIADRIDLMPAAAFKNSDAANKATLSGQMEEIYALLKQADDSEIALQNYAQAAQMLSDNVIPLIDGCTSGSTGDDLIADCAYQKEVYAAAQQLIEDCLNK